jgi:putative ABC transport system permease protein
MGRSVRALRAFGAAVLLLLALALPIALLAELPGALLGGLALLLVLWIALTRHGAQVWSITWIGLATIPQRLGSASVVVVGIAGVVAVLVALLAMAAGFEATLRQTGSEDTAIVMRAGSQTEINSVLSHEVATLVSQAPQIVRDAHDQPIASDELVLMASIPEKKTGLDANVELRGIGEQAWALHPQLRILAGRRFRPGLRELIVGNAAREQFAGVDVGSTLKLNGQLWSIVGAFQTGDAHDSELWADTEVVGATYRRGSSVAYVTVRLINPAAIAAFKAGLASDPRIQVDASTTRDYYNAQSEQLSKLIRILGTTVGVIMAIGAVFGALNTMYATVAARSREIATLRAIGFGALPVVAAVILETMLLATLGGALGALFAWLVFHHFTASTLGANFSQVVFAFDVSPALLGRGLKWALAIGLIGGLFPALRAARMPVTAGLREL